MSYRTLRLLSVLAMGVLLGACGGGGSNGSIAEPTPEPSSQPASTGLFLDSAVGNIGYRTASYTGVTNAKGEYQYAPGETVVFFVGGVELPAVAAGPVLTPLSFAEQENTVDEVVVNISRLLQTLDVDGNPDNGITITEEAKMAATTAIDFSVPVSEFAVNSNVLGLVANAGQNSVVNELVSVSEAILHLEDTLGSVQAANNMIGLWQLTERPSNAVGASDGAFLILLADSSYYFIEANEINDGDDWEFGTHSFDGILSLDASLDANTAIGPAGAELEITLAEDANSFSVAGDENEIGNYVFTRKDVASDGIVGLFTYLPELENKILFAFTADGTYIAVQPYEVDGDTGFEFGSYTYAGGQLSVTIIKDIGGSLLADESSSETLAVEVSESAISLDFGDLVAELTRLDASSVGEGETGDIIQPADGEIAGVWKLSERPAISIGGSDAAFIVMLSNGDYYFIEVNEIHDGDDWEYGTYTYANNELSFTAELDLNAPIGVNGADLAISFVGNDTFTFESDGEGGEEGYYSFERVALNSGGIAGTWSLGDGSEVLFVFADDGTYFAIQPYEEDDDVGFEYGSYTENSGQVEVNILKDLGGSLLGDGNDSASFTGAVSSDVLTLNFGDESVSFNRAP